MNSKSRSVVGTSNTFIVFPGSSADTGLLRQTSIALMYSGPYTVIQGVVDAFNVSVFQVKLSQIDVVDTNLLS